MLINKFSYKSIYDNDELETAYIQQATRTGKATH